MDADDRRSWLGWADLASWCMDLFIKAGKLKVYLIRRDEFDETKANIFRTYYTQTKIFIETKFVRNDVHS